MLVAPLPFQLIRRPGNEARCLHNMLMLALFIIRLVRCLVCGLVSIIPVIQLVSILGLDIMAGGESPYQVPPY